MFKYRWILFCKETKKILKSWTEDDQAQLLMVGIVEKTVKSPSISSPKQLRFLIWSRAYWEMQFHLLIWLHFILTPWQSNNSIDFKAWCIGSFKFSNEISVKFLNLFDLYEPFTTTTLSAGCAHKQNTYIPFVTI